MNVAIIPARGGSKRIPRKNIRNFCGKPMISWSIQAAQESHIFDEVVVSTDDPEIADVARNEGASIPFLRSPELSDSYSPLRPVFDETITRLEAKGHTVDQAGMILATAPLLTGKTLREGYDAWLADGECEQAMSVVAFSYPPQRGFVLDDRGHPVPPPSEHLQARSQDLPRMYHDAGQFYFCRRDRDGNIPDRRFIDPGTFPVILPHYLVQDIDDEEDWKRAELLFQSLREQR
jgi:N-acylneuraminate cytidylyltransferase